MLGVQAVKNHKKVIAATAAFAARLAWNGPERHWQLQLTGGVDVFAHVCEQTVDILSNCCDNNNIHSAIWMKLYFLQIWCEF